MAPDSPRDEAYWSPWTEADTLNSHVLQEEMRLWQKWTGQLQRRHVQLKAREVEALLQRYEGRRRYLQDQTDELVRVVDRYQKRQQLLLADVCVWERRAHSWWPLPCFRGFTLGVLLTTAWDSLLALLSRPKRQAITTDEKKDQ